MFLLCFFINCIKLIKETAVSACVFGYQKETGTEFVPERCSSYRRIADYRNIYRNGVSA